MCLNGALRSEGMVLNLTSTLTFYVKRNMTLAVLNTQSLLKNYTMPGGKQPKNERIQQQYKGLMNYAVVSQYNITCRRWT